MTTQTNEELTELCRAQVAHIDTLTLALAEARAMLNAAPECADPVVETNVALLRLRSSVGIAKYGTTVAGNKLPLRDWLNHALEETLDNANYLQRAMQEIDAAPALLPEAIRNAFVTLESTEGRYSIVMKFNQRDEAFAVHDFLLGAGGKEWNTSPAPATPAGSVDTAEGFTLDRIADAFASIGLGDSWFETLSIELLYGAPPAAPQQHAQAAQFPQRDICKPAEQQGIFEKFRVQRTDGSDMSGGKHHGCKYFVLDLDHDIHAGMAIRAYAKSCRATHPILADDIEDAWGRFENDPAPAGNAQAGLSDDQIINLMAKLCTSTGNEGIKILREVLASQQPAAAPAQAAAVPEGFVMVKDGEGAALRILREALHFYADGSHFMQHDPSAWDTVSGEPENFYEDESNTATVEDGSVAKKALEDTFLAGTRFFDFDDEDTAAPSPVQREVKS